MGTILFLIALLGVIRAVYAIIRKTGSSSKLNRALDEIDKAPKILKSKFNTKENRNTSFSIEDHELVIETDIQFYEINERGEFKILVSSIISDIPVKAELFCLIDPNSLGFEVENKVEPEMEKIGIIYSDNLSKDILNYLKEKYQIENKVTLKGQAFELYENQITTNQSGDKIELYGQFNDGGSYMLYIDLPEFKMYINADLNSLQNLNNFPVIFVE